MAKKRRKKPVRKPPAAEPAADVAPAKPARLDEERPPAPWGSFPLTQLTILAGLIFMILGAVTGNVSQLFIGLLLGSAGGLELSIREHFAGYRSHTTLLSAVIFVVTTSFFYFPDFPPKLILWQALLIGAASFALAFWLIRRAFQKASGGLSYRVR
jgi:hypothetical protein